MNRLNEVGDAGEGNLLLEQYLQDLEKSLGGVLETDEAESFLTETRVHLEQAIRTHREKGLSLLESTQRALERFGPAKTNGDDYVASWFQYKAQTPMTKRLGRANLVSFGMFQLAEVIYFLILQIEVFLPGESVYRIPFSPAQVRSVWPEPLPFPDTSFRFLVLIGYPVLAPLVAGWLVGRMVPVRAAAAVYRGLTPLILISFVMGALLLPMTEGLLFALFQVAFWLPVGCFTAHVSSNLARSRNCKAPDQASDSLRHSYLTEK
jgi:hypothetical protein